MCALAQRHAHEARQRHLAVGALAAVAAAREALAVSITQRALSVTQRALSVTQSSKVLPVAQQLPAFVAPAQAAAQVVQLPPHATPDTNSYWFAA